MQESIFKCSQPYHDRESAIYLFIKPECKLQPVCCKLCVKEQHKNHQFEELISINEIDHIESLQLSQCYTLIQQLENNIKTSLKMMLSFLQQIDLLKLLQKQPSIQVLKDISQTLKTQRNYQEIKNKLNQLSQQIYQHLEQMNDFLKGFQSGNQNYWQLSAEERYQKGYDLYWNQIKFEEAIVWFDRVLEMDNKHKLALHCKAESLRMLNRYQESIEYADRAIAIDPKYKEALHCKAESLRMLNRFQESIEYTDRAIKIDPKYKEALYTKAESLRMLNRYLESIEYADRAIAIDSKYKEALHCKAESLRMLNRFQESIEYADRAIAIDSKYNFAFTTKGASLLELKRYKEALNAINEALKIQPNYQFAQMQKELILKAMKQ